MFLWRLELGIWSLFSEELGRLELGAYFRFPLSAFCFFPYLPAYGFENIAGTEARAAFRCGAGSAVGDAFAAFL